MADKVKPLGFENTGAGGGDTYPLPTELDPQEDYVAAKGISFQNTDDKLIDLDGSGNIQFKDFTETTYWPLWKLKRALYNVFNPSPTSMVSTNTEDAIKEVWELAQNASRAYVLVSYGGNANAGRYLELFPSIPMNEAPLEVVNPLKVLNIFARTTAANATCTIGFYNITPVTPVLLYTLTFTAQKKVSASGTPSSPVFTVPANGQLAIVIDSGSISKPHLYFTAQGG